MRTTRMGRGIAVAVAFFLAMLLETHIQRVYAATQTLEPQIGDYVYCEFNWWFIHFSWFGHAAIYVGELGGTEGDVVERTESAGVRFRWLRDLITDYPGGVHTATVTSVPASVRRAAAELAVAVAHGGGDPWYHEPYWFGSNDCVNFVQRLLRDSGASEDQVGRYGHLKHPSFAYHRYLSGRTWDRDLNGNRGVISSGTQGGVESRPLWLKSRRKAPLLESGVAPLGWYLPAAALNGEPGNPVTPPILGASNAVSAAGMDYVDPVSGQVIASILAAETIDGVYVHDYAVCARVRQLEIVDLYNVPIASAKWWVVHAAAPASDSLEVVVPFTMRLSGANAVIDSRYPMDRYSPITGTVLNYQVRATNLADAMFLVEGIIEAAATDWTLNYSNVAEPPPPTTFVRSALYQAPSILLGVQNSQLTHSVRFYGTVWTEPRASAARWVDITQTISPDTSTVTIPIGRMFDALLYVEDGEFLDKAYVPSGSWTGFDDASAGGTSQVVLRLDELEHAQMATADTGFVSPPLAEMTGSVTTTIPFSYIGIAYSPNQERAPIDISLDHAVAFVARGDGGRYRVKLESAAVADNDYHGAPFTAPADWTLITIPFSELQQEGWGAPVAWTGTDIRSISFVTVDRPLASVRLEVDRIAFLSDQITSVPVQLRGGGKLAVQNSPNPFTRSTEFLFTVPAATRVTLAIFDVRGRRIRTLLNGQPYRAGQYQITWNGAGESGMLVPAGVYLWRFDNGQHETEGKLVRK